MRIMYCLFWPFTVIDFVPDVVVGVLPQPGELLLTTCRAPMGLLANFGLKSKLLGAH